MQRKIRIQLQPDIETAKVLSQTIEQYTWSFNAVSKYGWENDLANGVELHKATYYDHRAELSNLETVPHSLRCPVLHSLV